MHQVLGQVGSEQSGFHGNRYLPLSYNGENVVATLATSFLVGSSSFLGITKTTITYRDEFEFEPDSALDYGISCP